MSFDVTTLALAKSYTDQHGGGGSGGGGEKEIFKIPVTVTEFEDPADGEYFKVEHTVTLAELDAAAKEGKTPIVLADKGGVIYNLPLLYCYSGTYMFCCMIGGAAAYMIVGMSSPDDESETPEEVWQYQEDDKPIDSKNVSYYNRNNTSLNTAEKALDKLLTDSHTHSNKAVLDKLSASNGKLQYNGSDVGLKGDKGDTPVKGTDYWTAADKAEIVNDTLAALPTWAGGSY